MKKSGRARCLVAASLNFFGRWEPLWPLVCAHIHSMFIPWIRSLIIVLAQRLDRFDRSIDSINQNHKAA